MRADFPPRDFWIESRWPAAPGVRAGVTTRLGGASGPPWNSFNLALHVGDDPESVIRNRRRLRQGLELPAEPRWLDQQHGARVIDIGADGTEDADGAYTDRPGLVCAVLTADCIPLLLAAADGTEIAAVHVGWRGLRTGVVESALARFRAAREHLLAWTGPHIRARNYVVGDDVRNAFLAATASTSAAFTPAGEGRWHADLQALLRTKLKDLGVTQLHDCGLCTFQDAERFYSHRRSRPTGRMAALIWMQD